MIKHEDKKDMTITFSNAKTAYAYEGPVKLIFHNGAWIKSKKLTITFDKQEAQQHENNRIARSNELLWWAGASGCEMPATIECGDGLFQWIEPGYDIMESGLFKI
ncbi:hypothetical protein [Paenibacillus sp. B2(2019)]|uniref:hypothetical protein n=1 Tax=Paenibacillus sp. B2(2019) TaxID=2607754 RepID=UPI0011F37AB1|nr:hypothetical protein [Paenibacillus sp. B2(2019)]KAA1181537.1 hypothetical protein PAENI_22455 [Paenibacillus sp. B2(2019)]